MQLIRNIEYEKVLPIASQVNFQKGQVVSKTLAQNEQVSLTLFAFDQGEEISAHTSKGDALVIVLEGSGEATIGGTKHTLRAGDSIVMPAGIPHAVFAKEPFKMFLVVVFPQEK
jgi:quercetin dioxygenase-like cupin family protein